MPLYKFVGNRILTRFQNATSGMALSEWHSGYRAYRVDALADVPFDVNSDGFDFDTEIILQLHSAGKRIAEVPIPTYYGDEICYVNGVRYARDVVRHSCATVSGPAASAPATLARVDEPYAFKPSTDSSHGRVLQLPRRPSTAAGARRRLRTGAGSPRRSPSRATRSPASTLPRPTAWTSGWTSFVRADLDDGLPDDVGDGFDVVVAADVLEHVREPARLLGEIVEPAAPGRTADRQRAELQPLVPADASPLGQFDYDQRGILDATHVRFFTRRSFLRMARAAGLVPIAPAHTGLPFDALGAGTAAAACDAIAGADRRALVRAWPTMFAYQFVFELVVRGDGEPIDVTDRRADVAAALRR